MKVTFIGVGSAFDEKHTNISLLVEANGTKMLLDCGYDVPHTLWQYNDDIEYLDAIWISHPHADHYFGLGTLIMRMMEEGRKKTLHILTRPDIKKYLQDAIELSYPGLYKNPSFEIKWLEFEKHTEFGGMNIKISSTIHSGPNKAIRIEHEDSVLAYSGDGKPTDGCWELYRGADLLVHEAFMLDTDKHGHGNVKDLAANLDKFNVKKLAIVHINRTELRKPDFEEKANSLSEKIIIPKENYELII